MWSIFYGRKIWKHNIRRIFCSSTNGKNVSPKEKKQWPQLEVQVQITSTKMIILTCWHWHDKMIKYMSYICIPSSPKISLHCNFSWKKTAFNRNLLEKNIPSDIIIHIKTKSMVGDVSMGLLQSTYNSHVCINKRFEFYATRGEYIQFKATSLCRRNKTY